MAVDDGLEIGGGHPFGRSSFDVSNPLGAPPFSPVFGERAGATKGGPCSIYFNSESTFRVRRVTSRDSLAHAVRNGGGQGWGTRGVSVNDDKAIIYKNALDPYKAVQGAFTKLYFDGVFGTWAFQMPAAPRGPWAGSFPPPVVTSMTAQGLSAVTIKGSNLARAVAVNFGTYTVPLTPDCTACPWSPDGTSLNVSAPYQLGGQRNTVDVR